MSIDKGAETLALKERTYLVEIFCEAGDDPIIRAHRETVRLDDKGAVVTRARDIAAVERTLTQVPTSRSAAFPERMLPPRSWRGPMGCGLKISRR